MAAPPVTRDTTIARALAADPGLLERLVAFNPAFRKLKNPILRRTMARLATFADAARVAGVPLEALLDVANGAAPQATPAADAGAAKAAASVAPAPDWVRALDHATATHLDVRPILASGEDPFAKIMAVVAKLPPGAILMLEAPFDPAPLRRVLAGKGFAEHAECLAPDHWRVYFRKTPGESRPAAAGPPAAGPRIWRDAGIAHIDVRGLNPPEPMLAILRLLEQPDCSATVIVHHEREPMFLYPELDERGWRHEVVAGEPGEVRLALTRGA
ncbi:MAG TPA: DUF2249 domain-containing protein [Alphaproteobacteria bacterium]|jgi:hypothetical protein